LRLHQLRPASQHRSTHARPARAGLPRATGADGTLADLVFDPATVWFSDVPLVRSLGGGRFELTRGLLTDSERAVVDAGIAVWDTSVTACSPTASPKPSCTGPDTGSGPATRAMSRPSTSRSCSPATLSPISPRTCTPGPVGSSSSTATAGCCGVCVRKGSPSPIPRTG